MTDPESEDAKKTNQFNPIEVDLHIAEYNAMTTRCTYIMSIQNIILAALVGGLAAIANSKRDDLFYVWVIIFGIQAFLFLSGWFFYENYLIVRYIEGYLRPL